MANRERYITKRNEYDMIKVIEKNLPPEMCPIETISGKYPDLNYRLCWYGGWDEKCDDCIQKWLNEEAGE